MKLVTIFDSKLISRRVGELGAAINAAYGAEPLVAVCVLKGASIFFADLARSIGNPDLELDFVRLASYGKSQTSSGHVIFNKDIETDIRNKHVLIVEDIVDSGRTMEFLVDQFMARQPRSLKIAALVDKHERRESGPRVDFAGFWRDSGFLVGYGMDYAERYRTLPDICEIIN